MTDDALPHFEEPELPLPIEVPIEINGKLVLRARWNGEDWEVRNDSDWRAPTGCQRTLIYVASRNLEMSTAVAELEAATQAAQRVYADPDSGPVAQLAALDQLAAAMNAQHALQEERLS